MQEDSQGCKPEDEHLLESDSAHVDIQTDLEDMVRGVVHRGHGSARGLHYESQDVESDEQSRETDGGDADEFLVVYKEVDHAAEDHVEEGVYPCS